MKFSQVQVCTCSKIFTVYARLIYLEELEELGRWALFFYGSMSYIGKLFLFDLISG